MIENTIVYYDYYTFLSKKEIIKNAVVLEKSNKPASHLCSVTKHLLYLLHCVRRGNPKKCKHMFYLFIFYSPGPSNPVRR